MARSDLPLSEPRIVKSATGGGALSLLRGVCILEVLAERGEGLSLSELARVLAVNKSIALRLSEALVEAGFLFCNGQTGLYELTFKLSNLGLRKLDSTRILDQSDGVLRQLAERTGELARLAMVEHERRITWVLAATGVKRSLRIDPNHRFDVDLASHATGKAWLSTLPWKRAWQLIQEQGAPKHTPHSLTRRRDIEADIDAARRRGYAVTYEENELGVGAVAAPILVRLVHGEQTCVGVVSLAAPTYRMTKTELMACAPQVIAVTRELAAIWPIHLKESGSAASRAAQEVT